VSPSPLGRLDKGKGNQYERGCAPLERPTGEMIKEGLREASPPCHNPTLGKRGRDKKLKKTGVRNRERMGRVKPAN